MAKKIAPSFLKTINTPHDLYLKDVMEDKETARDFFKAFLAQDLIQEIDWTTLAIADPTRLGRDAKQLYFCCRKI